MMRSLFVCLVLLLSGVAAAQDDFSYTWLQVSWSDVDSDNFGAGDGLGLSASFELSPNFHVFGAYTGIDANSSADSSGWAMKCIRRTAISCSRASGEGT